MIRLSTALWVVVVIAVGYGMFQVKYEVMQLEEQLARVNRSITEDREAIRVLNAEWSFLTQPSRLDQLAKRHLALGPIGTSRLGRLDALPERPGEGPALAAAPAQPRVQPAMPAASPASIAGTRVAATAAKVRAN
jgi:cell division protein FtsL